MKQHGTVFWLLGLMPSFWYCNERRRERFVKIREDRAYLSDTNIAITRLEWLALALSRRVTGRGLPPEAYALNLLSGLCLMLALRCALQDRAGFWAAGCLAASGLAHLACLRQRWQGQRETTQAFLA